MPSKKKAAQQNESKKTLQKKKQQSIEDKTFGLKNKNKSKKVQQQVEGIRKNVMHGGDPKLRKMEEERKKAKEAAKIRRKEQKAEQDALFGEALMAVQKKSKSTNQKDGKVEAVGRDGNDANEKKGTSRAMKMMFQMDAKEMEDKLREDPNYVPTLEDEIESERQKKVAELKSSGKKGTPITPETFAVWQERKRKLKADEAKKLVEAEFRKKKGGKGLSILSGRALYEYKKELFDKADNDINDEDGNNNNGGGDENGAGAGGAKEDEDQKVAAVASKVQSELFLEGDDDDLDDLIDEDDE